MKAIVLGATKGMGRELARQMARRGDELFLLGRDLGDLERSAVDLQVRGSLTVAPGVAHCDLAAPEGFDAALAAGWEALGKVDLVLVTAGLFASQDALEADTELALQLLRINFAHTVTFCEYAKQRLLDDGGGTLCVFSSVAGDRARKPVVIYGASKAGLSAYLEGLDHKYRSHGLITVCVKPGFVKTGMTAGLKPPPFAGEPAQVATQVLRAIDRKRPTFYTPFMWRWVMLVIRSLPRFVMRRIGF